MDISKTLCPDCGRSMRLTRASCDDCDVSLDGAFEVSALGRLPQEEQIFVVAFLRHHGSIRKMEQVFEISYPTVKNRLRGIVAQLDEAFAAPSPTSRVLEQLARGELTVDEALRRI